MRIVWLLGGNVIYAFTQWLILVILARFFLAEDVGGYFFALALIAPLTLLFSLKLPNLVVTLEDEYTKYKDIFSIRFFLTILLIFIVYILYFIFFQNNLDFLVLTSVLVYKLLEQFDEVIIAYHQKDLKFKNIFILKLARSIVYTSLILIFSILFNDFDKTVLFSILTYCIYWLLINRKYIYINFSNFPHLNLYIKNGLYLSVSSSISSLSVSGVRMYIGYILGNSVLAIYGVISYSLMAFSIIIAALGQYFLPLFVKSKDIKNNFFGQIFKSQVIIFLISMFFIIISYFYGNQLLGIFYGQQYREYGYYLCLVFLSSLFKSSSALIGTAMTALKIYDFQFKFTIFSLVFTIILTPFFILNYNLVGAFFSLLIVNIFEWLLYVGFSIRKFKRIF